MTKIVIPFNKDLMTAKDLKACADALSGLLRDFDRIVMDHEDWGPQQAEEFTFRFLQIADAYNAA